MIKSTVRAPDMILTYGNEIDRRRKHTVPLGIIRPHCDKSRELKKKTKARNFPKRFTVTDVITVRTVRLIIQVVVPLGSFRIHY